MQTDFTFLRALEQDLERVARDETARSVDGRGGGVGGRGGRGDGPDRRWKRALTAVAAVFVLAWGIGFVADGGGVRNFVATSDSADELTGPMPADDDGAGGSPDRVRVGEAGFDNLDGNEAPEDAPAASPAPVSGTPGTVAGEQGGDRALSGELTKIIRNGRLRVEVEDGSFRDARAEVVEIAEDAGGLVLSSRTQGRSGTFTLKVPAATFDRTMVALGQLGKVELEEQTGQDVTAEFVDLGARQRILKTQRTAIEGFMARATSLPQTLLLAKRSAEVQLELERIQGRLRYLSAQVEQSTIEVLIEERSVPEARVEDEVDNPSLLQAWRRSIQGFFNVVAVAIVGLGYLLPLLVAAGVYLGVRELRLRRRRRDVDVPLDR